MYTIVLNNDDGSCFPVKEYVYLAGNQAYTLSDIRFSAKLNEASSLSFTMYPDHPLYQQMRNNGVRKMRLSVIKTADGQFDKDTPRMFNGEVDEISIDKYGAMSVFCVGALANYKDTLFWGHTSETFPWAVQYIKDVLDYHNLCTVGWAIPAPNHPRQITYPGNDVLPSAIHGRIYEWDCDYANIYELITKFAEENNLYIKLMQTCEETRPTLVFVYINDFGKVNESQNMYSRVNIIDINQRQNSSNKATAIVPIGKDNLHVNGFIASEKVNDYGYIYQRKEFSDIADIDSLEKAARLYLAYIENLNDVKTIKAVDLADAGYNVDEFKLGDRVSYYTDSESGTLPITAVTLDFLHPENNTYTLGISKEFKYGMQAVSSGNGGGASASPVDSDLVIEEKVTLRGLGWSFTYLNEKEGYRLVALNRMTDSTPPPVRGIHIRPANAEGKYEGRYTIMFDQNLASGESFNCLAVWIKTGWTVKIE